MRLSILTTITNPEKRQDKWHEALACYLDLADEVIVVDGTLLAPLIKSSKIISKIKYIFLPWSDEWSWEELPKHLNTGLDQCTGDWVLKLDIDQFIHEKDFVKLRTKLEEADSKYYPTASLSKFTVFSPTKAFQKGQIPIAINRRSKSKIAFGLDPKIRTDLCYPILVAGWKEINGYKLPIGNVIEKTFRTGIRLYNYDYFFKDLEFSLSEFERFARAYERFFKTKPFSAETFLALRRAYSRKTNYKLSLDDHPKYIRKAVREVIEEGLRVVGSLYA